MALSCSCMVFCPCVLSLGEHPPTEDRCQTWAGIRIDECHFDMVDLSGSKVGLMMDLPGIMAGGKWTAALVVDEKSPIQAVKALTRIFTGRVGGTTHLLSILVGQFLGVHQVPISYETQGDTRIICLDKYGAGAIWPVKRKGGGAERNDPQQPILDWPRRDRFACRQVTLPRLRAQLESGRPFGRDRQAGLGQSISGPCDSSRFRHPRFHRQRRSASVSGLDLRDRRTLGGDVLLPRYRADRRRRRRAN